jgi:ribonuclease P/MRP protein subunit RPP40
MIKINKAYSFLGLIKINFTYLSKDAFITLYKALVRSHLEYAVQLWSPYTVAYIKNIEKVQMRATKLITCIKHLPYVERLSYLKLPTLHYRRLRGDMIMVFKIVTGIMDRIVSCNFISSHSVTRGNRYKLSQKHVHYNLINYSFTNRVVSIWNSLPDYVVSACSVKVFEKRLDYFWRNQECLQNWKADLSGIGNRSLV